MKHTTRVFTSLIVVALTVASAQAGVTYTPNPTGAAWIGSPNYVSANNANFATLSTPQGDPAITGANGVLAETFTPSSSFILGSFNLIMQATVATNFSIHLYDLGPAGTVSVSSAAATYTPGADLFSGLSFSPATTAGSVQGQFTLSGADQVALLANEEYALEIWTPAPGSNQNGFLWYRGSVADPGGQMFSDGDNTLARNTLAGNGQAGGAPRTAGLALYAVPEPSALALLGLGVILANRRREQRLG